MGLPLIRQAGQHGHFDFPGKTLLNALATPLGF
jgi:hypothetical protein